MALGHALLHPERVHRALDADASADVRGATVDAALGLFGFGDPGPAASAWAEGLTRRAEPVVEAVSRVGSEGPFAVFFRPPAAEAPDILAQLGGLVDAAATLDADALRLNIGAALGSVLDVLPDLRLPDIAGALNTELDAALGILEAPLRDGRRDAAAHRAFRTAAEIRRRLKDLGNPIPPTFANFDPKAFLRAQLGRLEAPALSALATQIGAFRTEFGALFDALGRVSVRVEVTADGPQPMADPVPTLADEAKVTPFPVGHGLWILDLVTGIAAVFNLFWEIMRTRNFKGRGFDGFVSVTLLLWQTVRVVLRAAIPDRIAAWPSGAAWLFSDQGDFVLSIGARFFAAFTDAGAATNWVGSNLIRGLKHVTAVSQLRWIYQFARSIWYFEEWRKKPKDGRDPPSFVRTTWAAWGPMWFCGFFAGLFPFWEDFHLEGFPTSLLVPLIIGGVCALAVCISMLAAYIGRTPADDHASHGLMTGTLVFVVILVAVLLDGLESDDKGTAIGALIGVSIGVAVALVLSWIPQTAAFGRPFLISLIGLVCAYAIPFVLWWDYIDDGRDKLGLVGALDAGTSPYRLPYTAGENWMCSQGNHGIFSHHTKDGTTNHYAYDFNEVEGSVVRAARDGVITELEETYENRKSDPNFLHVLHTTWVAGHDPGTDDERVITFGNYFHLMQGGVLPVLGQTVQRGEDIARLDSTGRSAQQHIHIATEERQRGDEQGLPFVFGDEDTLGFRQYPFLAWIKGKGGIPGKPISYAFYTSSNEAPSGTPSAATLEMALDEGGPGNHLHRVVIPAASLAGAGDVVVFSEPQNGHVHRVTLTRTAIAALRGPQDWNADGITVDPAPDGHTHAPLRHPLVTMRLNLERGTSATAGAHLHDVLFDLATVTPGIPATTTVTSGNDYDGQGASTPPPAAHQHPVDFAAAAVRALLRRELPDAADVTVQTADGHSHTLARTFPEVNTTALPGLTAAIVSPPRARLTVDTPGPYRLFGGQAILRINGRVSEPWLLGAHRPQLLPDLPAERGLAAAEPLRFGATDVPTNLDAAGSPRAAAAALTRALRLAGGRLAHAAVTPVPVIVIETRTRGTAARLRRTGGAAIFGAGAGPEVRGAGDLPDIGNVSRAALAAHIQAFLRNGWPAPTVSPANAFQAGGPPLDLTGSAPRTAAVLTIAARPSDGRIATPQPLPLQPGPVGVTGGWTVPVLAAPALLRLDLNDPAMTGAARAATPLLLTVSGVEQPVAFAAEDDDAAKVARRIMLRADGVRAVVENATTVTITTIAGGTDARLALRKDPGLALVGATGTSATLAATTAIADTGAVPPGVLRNAVADAAARVTPPYDPAAIVPTVAEVGDRLRFSVTATHTIRRAAEGLPMIPGAAPAGQTWESDPLPPTLSFPGSSWLDVEVDAATARIPITGEPARLEIGPLPQLPAAGDELRLEVDGTPVTVTFDGIEGSVERVAERIALAAPGASVRFAWCMVVGGTLHGGRTGPSPLRLSESPALNILGFLRDRATLTDAPAGPVGDAMAAGPNAPVDSGDPTRPAPFIGPRTTRLTVPAPDPPSLVAGAADTLTFTAPAPDPLGMTVATNTATITAALPVALPADVATYTFTAAEAGVDRAVATAQLAALPAALRGTAAPEGQGTGPLPLTVTVTSPAGARPPVTVDLTAFADAEDAAARITRAPGISAFPVTTTAGTILIHVETLGRGTGWSLRLQGQAALVALGFRQPAYDPATDAVEATGGGTVADGAAVTAAEIRAMLLRAAEGAVAPEPAIVPVFATATPAPTTLLLAPGATGAPVPTIASDPPAYAATLNATATPAGLSIPGGTTRPLSALLTVTAGPRRVTVPLIGSPAVLRSPDPVPLDGSPEATEQLTFLQANGIRFVVDGAIRFVPAAPGPFATLDDAVEFIAAGIAPFWCGLIPDPVPSTARHFVVRSAKRGTDARVQLLYPAGAPPSGLLGFTGGATVTGTGEVPDADAMPVIGGAGSLQDELNGLRSLPDLPQTVLRAVGDDAAGTVRLVPNGIATLALPANLPASIMATLDGPAVLLATGPAQSLEARRMDLGATPATGTEPATVSAAFWGTPARLPALTLPNALAVLDGKTLDLVLDGTPLTITLGNHPTSAALAAAVARASGWRLRASADANTLTLETLHDGHAAALSLTGGSAITDDPATGLSAPARPVNAAGAGSVPDMAAATPTHIAAAFQAGWLRVGTTLDDLQIGTQVISRREYAPAAPAGDSWVLSSERSGVAGRLERLAVLPAPGEPTWNETLARGPAIRAAVSFAVPAPVSPNGDLVIRLDDNTGPGLPPPQQVTATFTGAALDAPGVAAILDAALRTANAGAAAAWPDGTVVVETATPGLAGSLEIPAPGTARTAADTLLGAATTLRARGWPGAGIARGFRAMQPGWRAVRATAAGNCTYEFRAAGRTTGPVTITAGMDAAAAAAALNTGFEATAANGAVRIGLAAVLDGALCVEASLVPMSLLLDGTLSVATDPDKAGDTPEPPTDPAFDLRRTDLIRTVRLLRAPADDPNFAAAHDFGWLRHPMRRDQQPAPAPGTPAPDATIVTASFPAFPVGRWLAAARPDAARTANAADRDALRAATAMAIRVQPGPGPGSPATPLILRYWTTLNGTDGQIGTSLAGPEPFMLDLLTWR